MSSLRTMMDKGRETAKADRQPAVAKAAPEGRTKLGTRMQLDLQMHLKRTALDLTSELGRRVSVEDVLEALVESYRDDAGVQERVKTQLR